MTDIDFLSLTQALQKLEIVADAAECHGNMSAYICRYGQHNQLLWLEGALPEVLQAEKAGNAHATQVKALLLLLFDNTAQQLQAGGFEYNLLLPDDDDSLEIRTEALGHWCQGFILGLQMLGIEKARELPTQDLAEIYGDIAEISQVSLHDMQHDEEEARSYVELVEYLRVGVMLFCEELHNGRPQSSDGQVIH